MDYVPFVTPAERSFDDTFFGGRLAQQGERFCLSPPDFSGCPVDFFGKYGIVS
jgi:hypothetical protein